MTIAPRLRWLLLTMTLMTGIGMATGNWLQAQMGLAVILWIAWEAWAFRRNLSARWPKAWVEHRLMVDDAEVSTLLKNRPATVTVRVHWPAMRGRVYAELTDIAPVGLSVDASTRSEVLLDEAGETTIEYVVRPEHAGTLRWPGVDVRLYDLQGFFRADRRLEVDRVVNVLPPLASVRNADRLNKRQNQLPPPGHHRHVRPGMGSELMEIREYVPGDSLRSIAWKLSARRDALMTKQYESEVPIRVRLIVDGGASVRWQHPEACPLTAFIELSGLISETMISNRDAVGLSLWNERGVSIIPPAARRQAPLLIVKKLLAALEVPWQRPAVPVDELLPPALAVMQSRFPEIWHGPLEGLPVGWRPWSWKKRAALRARYAVTLFIAGYYRLAEHDLYGLLASDDRLSVQLQRFLFDQGVPYPGSLFDPEGRPRLADAEKPDQLARLLSHAVAHARDNELMVLMVDLADLEHRLGGLEQAVKLAVARHHRVVMLCAWPPGLPLTLDAADQADAIPDDPNALADPRRFEQFARAAEVRRRTDSHQALRRRFGRFRVPVVPATLDEAPQLIVRHAELLRAGRCVA